MRSTPQTDSMQTELKFESAKWVSLLVKTLEGEGRLIEGGWPGTISEARRRVVNCLALNTQAPATAEELEGLVDLLYGEAKRLWLAQRC